MAPPNYGHNHEERTSSHRHVRSCFVDRPRVPYAEWLAGTQQAKHCPQESMSRKTRPLKIPARGAPYAHMVTCPSSLGSESASAKEPTHPAPRYPSLKLGPELGIEVAGSALFKELTSARSAVTLVAGGCHQLFTPTPRFNRVLVPCPRRARTAGDSRSVGGSSGCPLPAQSCGPPRWIACIKLVPKLTVRVRFPSPAPHAKNVAAQANSVVSLKRIDAHSGPKRHSCHYACP